MGRALMGVSLKIDYQSIVRQDKKWLPTLRLNLGLWNDRRYIRSLLGLYRTVDSIKYAYDEHRTDPTVTQLAPAVVHSIQWHYSQELSIGSAVAVD